MNRILTEADIAKYAVHLAALPYCMDRHNSSAVLISASNFDVGRAYRYFKLCHKVSTEHWT